MSRADILTIFGGADEDLAAVVYRAPTRRPGTDQLPLAGRRPL